jgi:hypothetical protein
LTILRLNLKRQHRRRGESGIQPEPAEPVRVVATFNESQSFETLDAFAELASNAQPVWKKLVHAIRERRGRRLGRAGLLGMRGSGKPEDHRAPKQDLLALRSWWEQPNAIHGGRLSK